MVVFLFKIYMRIVAKLRLLMKICLRVIKLRLYRVIVLMRIEIAICYNIININKN